MIEIKLVDVSFHYRGRASAAISDVSISFRKGETVLIYGPNGSGKTTLMKTAALIYRPSEGEVLLDGENFWSLSEDRRTLLRRKVTYVHEKPVMVSGTVMDNLLLGPKIRGDDLNEAEEEAKRWLSKFGMEFIADLKAEKLSSGQMQLISLIRAFLLSPDILFLDEPFAHLDREKRRSLEKVLKEGLGGAGIVISSHDESLSQRLGSDRIIYMEDGRIVQDS